MIIYHKIHITRFAMEYVWLRVQSKAIQQRFQMEYVWLEFKTRQFSRDFK